MIDSLRASYLIYRHRVRRRCRIEATRLTAAAASVVVVPLVVLAALWSPWDVIASVFSDIAKRIRDAIVWVANEISKIVVTVVNDVWSFAGDLASGIADAASFIADIGNSAFQLLKTVWDTWIPDAIHLATGAASALFDTAQHYLSIFRDWATQAINAIWGTLNGVWEWSYRNIFNPLMAQITGVWSWISSSFVPMIIGWIGAFVDPLWAFARDIYNRAVDVVAWFARFGAIAVRWFVDGLRFMLFILEHPTDWWHRMADEAFGRGSDALDRSVVALVERRGGDVLDGLSRWIG